MNKAIAFAAAACIGALTITSNSSLADQRKKAGTEVKQGYLEPTKSRYKRKNGTRVRAYIARGGYYSYQDSDVINTYAGSRTLFGSTNFYRDPFIDRQTNAGPFDHDFFFDSGIGPRGGDAPYPR